MENYDIAALEEKVELLTKVALYDDKIAHFVLSSSLGLKAYNAIFDIMDAFEQKPFNSYNYFNVESEFAKIGINRQALKCVLIIFYQERKFISTLTNYLDTNFKDHGNVSCELVNMYNDLVAHLEVNSNNYFNS